MSPGAFVLAYLVGVVLILWTLSFGKARWDWSLSDSEVYAAVLLWPVVFAILAVGIFLTWPTELGRHLRRKDR